MIIKRKIFSGTKILNTNAPGFIKGRKYDTDLDRLGRMETSQRELHKTRDLNSEIREMNKELNNGRLGKWQNTK
jgi:hypothetical protein